MFLPIEESNGEIFFKLKNRDAPQIKFNPSKPNEITIFPNDGSREIKTKINEGIETVVVKWGFWLMLHSMTPPSEQLKEISQVALNDPSLRTA